jgi:FixJ family two-component response regulator
MIFRSGLGAYPARSDVTAGVLMGVRRIDIVSKLFVIAVVDDDASVRVGTDNLLSSLGYTVHTFASAEEFLKSGLRYDSLCVIADVRMPGMSGIELQTLLLAQGHHVPFIFVTAFSQ